MGRDPFFDNAKAILIVFVVIGHGLELMPRNAVSDVLFLFIYTFHMPLFIFIAGYFAARSMASADNWKKTRRILGLYFLSQAFYVVLFRFLGQQNLTLAQALIHPCWTTWFLLSLACWRLLPPAFAARRGALAASTALALAAGCVDAIGTALSLSRTIVFMPFFLAGFLAARTGVRVMPPRSARLPAVTVLAAVGVGLWLHPFPRSWLFGDAGYAALGLGPLDGALSRLGALTLQAACGAAVLALVPRDAHGWTAIGRHTLAIYVVHPAVLLFVWLGVMVWSATG